MLFPALVNFQLHHAWHKLPCFTLSALTLRARSPPVHKKSHLTQSLQLQTVACKHVCQFDVLPAGGGGGEGLLTGSTFRGGFGMSSSGEMREDIDSSMKNDRSPGLKLINKMSSKSRGQYINPCAQTWEHFVDLVHLPDIVVQSLFLLLFFRNDARHIYTWNILIYWFCLGENLAADKSECDVMWSVRTFQNKVDLFYPFLRLFHWWRTELQSKGNIQFGFKGVISKCDTSPPYSSACPGLRSQSRSLSLSLSVGCC